VIKETETKIIGISKNVEKTLELIEKASSVCMSVLITGETGTGKELVARSLYEKSERNKNPFVKVNCAALPDTLMESELFGYEEGAFTGANKKRRGKFKMADNGVLFLDEIGDMSFNLQSKLLRVLQDGNFSPLGSEKDVSADVWIVSATNKNLEREIQNKNFRSDLYFRLNTINIHLLPLRERKEDISLLIDYYWGVYRRQLSPKNFSENEIPRNILEKLLNYDWPGNVRELQNVIKRLIVLGCKDEIIDSLIAGQNEEEVTSEKKQTPEEDNQNLKDISDGLEIKKISGRGSVELKKIGKKAVMKAEKQVILYVLNKTRWNRKKATEILDVSYPALLYKMKELDIYPH
jgi:transcriptional regulator with PAS, ATPase and Fis domain